MKIEDFRNKLVGVTGASVNFGEHDGLLKKLERDGQAGARLKKIDPLGIPIS